MSERIFICDKNTNENNKENCDAIVRLIMENLTDLKKTFDNNLIINLFNNIKIFKNYIYNNRDTLNIDENYINNVNIFLKWLEELITTYTDNDKTFFSDGHVPGNHKDNYCGDDKTKTKCEIRKLYKSFFEKKFNDIIEFMLYINPKIKIDNILDIDK